MPATALPATTGLGCVPGFLGLAGLAAVVGGRKAATPLIYGGSLAVALVALGAALTCFLSPGPPWTLALPIGLPGIGARFRIDALSAFFLVVVNLGAAITSLYALGYGRHEETPARVLPFYAAFLAGMNLVIFADDAFTFLLAWEFMSLASWAIVLARHRDPANSRAAFVYLVMASFGTLCLLLGFGLLAGPAGGYAFETIRLTSHTPFAATLAVVLALLGAGSKAGLVPLHVWLPLAHPAAPSHVSALLSGVMTKVGVYGFIRIVFDLAGPPNPWFGLVVLSLGGITAAIGVLYALMQHDLKRLLAYHTVENIGIIFIGLGLALAFRANGMNVAAALALTAALFHVFNHSVFKSLLFFGAGAVLTATGERDMERLGGLIHRMPQTALAFLIGCAAISALPPLNGFVSEWLTFQASGLLRQGIRRDFPGPPALAGRKSSRRGRYVLPHGDVSARSDLRPCRCAAGLCHRCALVRDGHADRGDNAAPGRRAVAVDRPDRRKPQFLQWAHHPDVPGRIRLPDCDHHSSLRHPGDAAERDLGLRFPARCAADPVWQREFLDADSAGVRHRGVRRARAR